MARGKGCGHVWKVRHRWIKTAGNEGKMETKKTPAQWKVYFESEEFLSQYVYEGSDLGSEIKGNETVFKLWSPVSESAEVCLYTTGSDAEEGAQFLGKWPMTQNDRGVWSVTIDRNLDGVYYTYEVTNCLGTQQCADPYGKAAGVNGRRSMAVDLSATNPEGWEKDTRVTVPPEQRVIYEIHVKDFSNDIHSGIPEEHRGKYLAFTHENTSLDGDGVHPTGLAYLKALGVTYVHMLPMYDFGSVDESGDLTVQFNWGYDPENYMTPEGSYSTNPWDGKVRIRELKEMIQALHKAGIGVIMDSVYNHTYHPDCCFHRAVPYYYHRLWEDGRFSDGSCCSNDTASERAMFRRYMIQAVCYWAEEYHLDGFRFDLMGLHDVDTMNEIRAALNKLPGGEQILMYGEPWTGGPTAMEEGAVGAVKSNVHLLDENISIFCDNTRDAIKGSVFKVAVPGYVNGKPELCGEIIHSIFAWCDGGHDFVPKKPSQLISYISAHDNYTLWDKILLSAISDTPDYQKRYEEAVKINKLAAGIYMTCQGIVFFQAGEEYGRTKEGIGDSYNSSPLINQLDWTRTWEMEDLVMYYRKLIALRKQFAAYGTYDEGKGLVTLTPFQQKYVCGYEMTWKENRDNALLVCYNPYENPVTVTAETVPGLKKSGWNIILGEQGSSVTEDGVIIPEKSVLILERRKELI